MPVVQQKSASGRSVSRILSGEAHRFTLRKLRPCRLASAIIHLCSLPETRAERAAPSSLLDLAPDGGYLAARIAANAGGLLRRLFTMTGAPTSAPKFVAELKHRTPEPRLLFSVALPTDFSVPGFPRRRALRSTDFPRLTTTESRDRPTGLRRIDHTREPSLRQRRGRAPSVLAAALWTLRTRSASAPRRDQCARAPATLNGLCREAF